MAESKAKLDQLAQADKERMMLEESKNKYESYIYYIRNKLIDDEDEISKVTSEEQREALKKSAEDAEEWMFDEGFSADLKTYDEKYVELSTPAVKAFFRMAELTARPKAIDALSAKLTKIEELMKKWETTMEHITEEERTEVLDKVAVVRKWIEDKVAEQVAADPTTDPVFTSEEVPGQTKQIESIVQRLMKKPKPKPVEKKNETEKNVTGSSDEEAGESSTEADDEKKVEGEENSDENAEKSDDSEEKTEDDSSEKKTEGDTEEKTEGDEL
jgi:hypoxia up-regulated 1